VVFLGPLRGKGRRLGGLFLGDDGGLELAGEGAVMDAVDGDDGILFGFMGLEEAVDEAPFRVLGGDGAFAVGLLGGLMEALIQGGTEMPRGGLY
jgi:hypothetical protein